MDHAIRLLSTASGTDKSFMLVQYSAILLAGLANLKKSGSQKKGAVAYRLAALAKLLSDARTTYRLWGLLPIFQWLKSLRTLPLSTSKTAQIERLQVVSMLIYYPLEHLYFLGLKKVLPVPPKVIGLAALYSCRAWATYTALHFFHLWEDLKQVERERKQIIQSNDTSINKSDQSAELKKIEGSRAAILNGLLVNLAYTPLTIHWSLRKGLYSSEVITGVCGVVAAVAQLRAGWKASAIASR
ncbi:peroxisomal biogenesis factor 11 [Phakopsora pachyrhizi]|uniref:Peroxisomal biogenesis factor 11 n=1 Tax=Phakopsora pachyrhizi TaxID=170000 RepID=A0AAV0BS93_PHAPC|nr:peroxisomal biogenesis factor 11 [Phakopsora pachyrhizi]CAH7689111.1 peroxisomal biogenesis factor 11 [Phakopsora pachyrhizi]